MGHVLYSNVSAKKKNQLNSKNLKFNTWCVLIRSKKTLSRKDKNHSHKKEFNDLTNKKNPAGYQILCNARAFVFNIDEPGLKTESQNSIHSTKMYFTTSDASSFNSSRKRLRYE